MLTRSRIIDRVIETEGGYVHDPLDAGGATRWGITERTARAHGYGGPMESLPRPDAVRIYERAYWARVQGDTLLQIGMDRLAAELFDCAVHCGVSRAVTWLQRALNALNDRARLYSDIPADGAFGPQTMAAVSALGLRRGERAADAVLRAAVNSFQCVHYISLSERRQSDERFVWGWLAERVVRPAEEA